LLRFFFKVNEKERKEKLFEKVFTFFLTADHGIKEKAKVKAFFDELKKLM